MATWSRHLRKAPWLTLALLAVIIALPSAGFAHNTFYLSPSGNNRNPGSSESQAWRTFRKAFSRMAPGDELVLLDGTYSEAAGTGYINYEGKNSDQIPSGRSPSEVTYVHAKHPGAVKILGPLFIGRSFRKDRFIRIEGITFEGGGGLYNTAFVTIKNCGFHATSGDGGAVFAIGSNDHEDGNTYDLIEDSWIWGKNRIIALTYRSDRIVWRRVVIRGDGCSTPECTGSNNPNVGITVYDSTRTSLQNVIVLDRVLNGGSAYADFAVAQHTRGRAFGHNEWLGTISLKAPDTAYYFEPDEASLVPAERLVNCAAWDPAELGINVARDGVVAISNCTVRIDNPDADAIRIAPALRGNGSSLRNLLVLGHGRFAVDSSTEPSYVAINGQWKEGEYDQTICTTGCVALRDSDSHLKYATRVDSASVLKGRAFAGADYGANIVSRYGVEGSRFGEPQFNALTDQPLWPWPNEGRIRKEMCEDSSVTRGLCSKPSLTEYIWTYLGSPLPAELGGSQSQSAQKDAVPGQPARKTAN